MADGSLEIYDEDDGFLRYDLRYRFLNTLGSFSIPALGKDGGSGQISDSRLSLGEGWAIGIRSLKGVPSGANLTQLRGWNTNTQPTFRFSGETLYWTVPAAATPYTESPTGGFTVYYGVF